MEEQIDALLETLKTIQTRPDDSISPQEKIQINNKRDKAVEQLMLLLKNRVDTARAKVQAVEKVKLAIQLAPQLIQKAIIAQSYLPPTLAGSVMIIPIIYKIKVHWKNLLNNNK